MNNLGKGEESEEVKEQRSELERCNHNRGCRRL